MWKTELLVAGWSSQEVLKLSFSELVRENICPRLKKTKQGRDRLAPGTFGPSSGDSFFSF